MPFSFLSPSQAEGSVSWDSRHHEGVASRTGLFLVFCVCGTVSNMIEILAKPREWRRGKSVTWNLRSPLDSELETNQTASSRNPKHRTASELKREGAAFPHRA